MAVIELGNFAMFAAGAEEIGSLPDDLSRYSFFFNASDTDSEEEGWTFNAVLLPTELANMAGASVHFDQQTIVAITGGTNTAREPVGDVTLLSLDTTQFPDARPQCSRCGPERCFARDRCQYEPSVVTTTASNVATSPGVTTGQQSPSTRIVFTRTATAMHTRPVVAAPLPTAVAPDAFDPVPVITAVVCGVALLLAVIGAWWILKQSRASEPKVETYASSASPSDASPTYASFGYSTDVPEHHCMLLKCCNRVQLIVVFADAALSVSDDASERYARLPSQYPLENSPTYSDLSAVQAKFDESQ